MKAYGVPRFIDLECPDVADIKRYGLKSAVGTIRGKGGDFRGYFKNKETKANTRRFWKKKGRCKLLRSLRKEIIDIDEKSDYCSSISMSVKNH